MYGSRATSQITPIESPWACFYGPNGAADQVLRVGRFGGIGRLFRRFGGWKQGDGRNSELNCRADGFHEQIDRKPLDAGHRGDRLAAFFAFVHKQRQNQVVGAQPLLGHEPARPIVAPQSPQPRLRILAPGRR